MSFFCLRKAGWPGKCAHAYIASIYGAVSMAQANTPVSLAREDHRKRLTFCCPKHLFDRKHETYCLKKKLGTKHNFGSLLVIWAVKICVKCPWPVNARLCWQGITSMRAASERMWITSMRPAAIGILAETEDVFFPQCQRASLGHHLGTIWDKYIARHTDESDCSFVFSFSSVFPVHFLPDISREKQNQTSAMTIWTSDSRYTDPPLSWPSE